MTDRELLFFLRKDIEVTLKSGTKFVGHAWNFEWGDDDEYESALGIYRDFHDWDYVEISPSEVDSIKVIERPKK